MHPLIGTLNFRRHTLPAVIKPIAEICSCASAQFFTISMPTGERERERERESRYSALLSQAAFCNDDGVIYCCKRVGFDYFDLIRRD